MIGRDHELRQLTRLVASGRPQVAIIGGEPGIGKTRLTQEFLDTLPPETVVLVGHAEPGSLARPTNSCWTPSTQPAGWAAPRASTPRSPRSSIPASARSSGCTPA